MKKLFYPLVLLLIANVILTGCRTDDNEHGDIVISNPDSLEQIVYADEETGASGVSFTALAPWTSSIREVPITAVATMTRNAADWLSIYPTSGGAGTHPLPLASSQT